MSLQKSVDIFIRTGNCVLLYAEISTIQLILS